MELEINAAVRWWAEALQSNYWRQHRNRRPDATADREAAGAILPPPTVGQLEKFSIELANSLRAAFADSGWDPSRPECNWQTRTLIVESVPCALLETAAEAAGLAHPHLRFPTRTIMWIDPGHVRVRCGSHSRMEALVSNPASLQKLACAKSSSRG